MKITRFIYSITLAAIIISASSCSLFKKSAGENTFTLKYNLADGQEMTTTSNVITKLETEQMGQTTTMDINGGSEFAYKVISAADGKINFEIEFKGMNQTAESPMGSQDADFSNILGKKAKFSIDQTGELIESDGFADLPELTNAVGETLSGEMYEQIARSLFFSLPDHAVKLGDSWSRKDTTEIPFGESSLKITSSSTYLVTEKLVVDGMNCLRIDINGTSNTTGDFQQNGMDLSMDRNATTTGHSIFAYDKGMYLSFETLSNTEGIIDVPAAGMKIPQKITSSTKNVVKF